MSGIASNVRGFMLLGGLGLAVALTGCGHVNQEDLDSQLADIRQQMQEGDQENADQVNQMGQRVDDLEGRVGDLEDELSSLESEFNTTVQRLESALRFSTPIHFAFDDSEIRPEDQEYLDRFASVVSEYYPDATVTVEGFTDPAGSEAYNMRLGQERADAVKEYLASNGLSGDRIKAVSYGENTERLVQPDAQGPEDGISNRRVVLVVDYVPREGAGSDSGSMDGGPVASS